MPCAAVQGVGVIACEPVTTGELVTVGELASGTAADGSTMVGNCTRCPIASEAQAKQANAIALRNGPTVYGRIAFKLGTEC